MKPSKLKFLRAPHAYKRELNPIDYEIERELNKEKDSGNIKETIIAILLACFAGSLAMLIALQDVYGPYIDQIAKGIIVVLIILFALGLTIYGFKRMKR